MRGFNGRLISFAFVMLWSSGFIVARLVRPYAEPLSFISLRFACAAALMALIAWAGNAPWPRTARGWFNNLVAGTLIGGVYISATFWAVKHGLPPAIAALLSGLQPLLTAALATPLLGERVGPQRWAGIVLGFAGALLVLAPNLSGVHTALPPSVIFVGLLAMLAITFGTIWQKRTGGAVDLRSGATIQLLGGLIVTLPFALAFEHGDVPLIAPVMAGLAWSVLVLNIAAGLLLLSLIKRGAVAAVTSLFYLSPPVTALMAFALFGESLAPIQFAGMALAAIGVAIASRG
jgi:drug/metabolite transporter (DMT)-like permease